MHVGAVSLAATPIAAGARGIGLGGSTFIRIDPTAYIYKPSTAVLWYMCENIDVGVEFEGIEIEVEQLIGVTTE